MHYLKLYGHLDDKAKKLVGANIPTIQTIQTIQTVPNNIKQLAQSLPLLSELWCFATTKW